MMFNRKVCGYVFLAGILLIWFVKLFMRTFFPPAPGTAFCMLMGVAPNLIGSILVPFAAHYLSGYLKKGLFSYLYIQHVHSLGFICLAGYLLGVVNEVLQLLPVFGRTFDWYDLVFSTVGSMMSFMICRSLMIRNARGYQAF